MGKQVKKLAEIPEIAEYTEVKVDIDERKDACSLAVEIKMKLKMILEQAGIGLSLWKIMRTKRGWHLYFRTYSVASGLEPIMLQAILGSDWKRELFNYAKWKEGREMSEWNVLYSEKWSLDGIKLSEEREMGIIEKFMWNMGWVYG
jgi:hypothetical protein